MVERRSVEAWERTKFHLFAGCYTVRVFNESGLNPGGITKWLRAEPCESYSMCLLFSPQLRIPPAVPVCFTVSDANYPGITALNGRIIFKEWRNRCMAASNHTINFQDGSSTAPVSLPVGTYSFVSTDIPGYETGTVTQFTVTPTTTSVALSVTANGALTVTVKDDLGNSITSGEMQLSNQAGGIRYGSQQSISSGTAAFANVPYTAAGINFYIAQDSSDENHDPLLQPQAVSMTQTPETVNVLNDRKASSVSFTMADATYAGITPVTGALVVNG